MRTVYVLYVCICSTVWLFNVNKLTYLNLKCVKMFFGYAILDSVTAILFYLGLPTIGTIIHNSIRCRFAASVYNHHSSVIWVVHAFCAF